MFNRLDILKVDLVPFFEEKARLAAEERQRREEVTNPQTKEPSTNMPTEDELMARLNRLNRPSIAKPTINETKPAETEVKPSETPVEKPERSPTPPKESAEETAAEDKEALLDFSIFDIRPKASKKPEEDADDPRLIPDVEIVDPRLDLSWLEEDPLFGAKNRPANTSSSSSSSATSSTNSTIASRENTLDRASFPVSADDSSKFAAPQRPSSSPSPAFQQASSGSAPPRPVAPPPSYDAFKKPVYVVPSEAPKAVQPSFPAPTAKYQVVTVSSEPPAPAPVIVPSSPFSLPSTADYASSPDFSITRTVRGQQFDAEAMNQRLLNTTVDATCSTFLPMPSGPPSFEDEPSLSPAPKSSSAVPQASSLALQGQKSPPQYVPVIAGGKATYATPPSSSSQQQRAAMLSLMGNVPVVFKPNHMNVFDASRAVAPSSSSAVSSASSTSSASSSKVSTPKPTGAPPAYGSVSAGSGSSGTKKSTPSSASSPKTGSSKQHSHSDKPPGYKKQSSSAVAKYTGSSAFPLLTNQRPGAAVNDPSLRTIEMEGDMFDRFVSLTNRNTVRGIETCGILAGTFLAQKNIFRVTHLIIPKQTGTSDTCATTNEDEIFDYQIKHDLLTLGWIHTHPTQACFLSSVDLHTQSSYQALFPEAVAVVIAPRDTPNFAFFHLSKNGFPTIQNCPLSGFHHHPERGLYEACSHVVLSWNSKKPCKVVDMR